MNNTIVMEPNGSCYGLFVDINDVIYCSLTDHHQVIKLSQNTNPGVPTIVAGNGSAGSTSDLLDSPRGIFVNINFDLYVADCNNNRIQLFPTGQLNGTTVAENIALDCPTSVILDGDDNLFIVDSNNHRILASNGSNFRCIAGCSHTNGSSSTELNYPQSIAFDSYGNIYVTDRDNDRVQKFILQTK